jgi:hypothetical protein
VVFHLPPTCAVKLVSGRWSQKVTRDAPGATSPALARPLRCLGGSEELSKLSRGVIGLLLAGFAVYAAYAAEFEDVLKRPLLPLGRRGKGEQAVKGTYAQQMERTVSAGAPPRFRVRTDGDELR